MSKQTEMEKLERTIKDTEMRIKTVESNLVSLDKEIDNLSNLEKTLEDNIACLKKKSIVALAQEFKKAKDDLKAARARISSLNQDKAHFKKVCGDMATFLEKTQKELEKLGNSNNVLSFKPEKPNE